MLDALAALAAKVGLLRKPCNADDDDGDASARAMQPERVDGGAAEPSQWLQLLHYASLLLRALPTRRGVGANGRVWDVVGAGLNLADVWEQLLLPAVRNEEPAVRCGSGDWSGIWVTVWLVAGAVWCWL